MPTFSGSTEEGRKAVPPKTFEDAPFLPAKWWEVGTVLTGEVVYVGRNSNGSFFTLKLFTPITLDKNEVHCVRVSFYAGIWIALKGIAKNFKLMVNDKMHLKCVAITPPTQEGYSPSPDFEIEVNRD
jgi:hypothetical protein